MNINFRETIIKILIIAAIGISAMVVFVNTITDTDIEDYKERINFVVYEYTELDPAAADAASADPTSAATPEFRASRTFRQVSGTSLTAGSASSP